jgi:predicted flap endonuclease-1-like 5' DNA nuclease
MTMLVIQTFLLMAAFVAIGIGIGVVARQTADRRADRLVAAGLPAPEEIVTEDEAIAAVTDWDPASASPIADDIVVDPDRAAGADQVGVRPSALSGPRDGRPDDLKVIRGIGPQNESRLNALGIHHLDQIAAWTAEEARWVGTYLSFPGRIEREDWPGQARALLAATVDASPDSDG